jgi:antitoxin VapB
MTLMALSIKNSETERLARQVARETGESLTEAIQHALRDRLERTKKQRQQKALVEKVTEILNRVRALPDLDTRSADEIMGYDEHGLPR